jgi:hypothetical protein
MDENLGQTNGISSTKQYVRSFLKSIEADDDKMAINYTLTLPPDNSSKEVISVLDNAQPYPTGS